MHATPQRDSPRGTTASDGRVIPSFKSRKKVKRDLLFDLTRTKHPRVKFAPGTTIPSFRCSEVAASASLIIRMHPQPIIHLPRRQRTDAQIHPTLAALIHLIRRQILLLDLITSVFHVRSTARNQTSRADYLVRSAHPELRASRLVIPVTKTVPDARLIQHVLHQNARASRERLDGAKHSLVRWQSSHQPLNLRFHPINFPRVLIQEAKKHRSDRPASRQVPLPWPHRSQQAAQQSRRHRRKPLRQQRQRSRLHSENVCRQAAEPLRGTQSCKAAAKPRNLPAAIAPKSV